MSYYPPVILAAGRINGVGNFMPAKTVKMLTWMFCSSVKSVTSVVKNPTPPSVVSVGNPRFEMSAD